MHFMRSTFRGYLLALSVAFGIPKAASTQVAAPITLAEAVSSAQINHPAIATARAAEDQVRAARKAAASGRLPTITAAEDVLYSNDPVFAFGSKLRQARFFSSDFDLTALNHPASLSNFSASVTASWTAFDAGATRNRLASANSSVMAAQLQFRYAEEQVKDSVTLLYYRVLMAEDQIAVADAAVKRAKEVDADVGDRVRAGLSLESDGARANLAFQDAQNDASSARDNVRLARSDFFETIGESYSDRPLARPAAEILTSENIAPPVVSASRLDLQAIGIQRQSAQETLASIRATAWPQISAFGHVENDAQHVVTGGSGNWTIGAKIQLNVFDGGLRKAHESEALANIERLAAQERSTQLEANAGISALDTQMADLRRRMVTAESAIQVQQAALQASRDRYASGLASITEVLNGESDLTSAEFQRVRTFYQFSIARADLEFAVGQEATTKAGKQ